ncbi:hypothetical protein V2J97_01245 [Pseudomonas alliivorans]|nr:hypothetical protein [Pseudomonas alliivorans]
MPWQAPQDPIMIDVTCYNDQHKALLTNKPYPTKAINELIKSPTSIHPADLFTYMLIHRKGLGPAEYSSIQSLRDNIKPVVEYSQLLIDFNSGSVRAQQSVNAIPGDITTRLGEAVGLCVLDKLHNLTLPDWTPIPEIRGRGKSKKTLDFITNTASSGVQFIQLETKGAYVTDNNKKMGSISRHKKDILDKKKAQRPMGKSNTLYYGAIGAFDKDTNRNAKCWLLDPPGDYIDRSPTNYRILARMTFIERWVRLIAPSSALSGVLFERVQKLLASDNIFQYDNKPLKQINSKTYNNPFLSRNTYVEGDNTGGFSIWIGNGQLAFIGFEPELFELALTQDFDELLSFRREAKTESKTVNFSLPEYFIPKSPQYTGGTTRAKPIGAWDLKELGDTITFKLHGILNYSQCGLVTGILGTPYV